MVNMSIRRKLRGNLRAMRGVSLDSYNFPQDDPGYNPYRTDPVS